MNVSQWKRPTEKEKKFKQNWRIWRVKDDEVKSKSSEEKT